MRAESVTSPGEWTGETGGARGAERMPLLVLTGPTCSGKSALALELAERGGGVILSVDSQQVYRGLIIGTGQPTPEEQARVEHRLVGHVDPRERYDAARFVADAEAAIAEIRAAGKTPLLVGGTGMYLKALLEGLFEGPARNPEVRARLESQARADGAAALHARLASVDPEAATRIHPNDEVRIVRALEVFEVTGRTISSFQAEDRRRGPRHASRFVVVNRPVGVIDARIARRTDAMLDAGWVEEVRDLLAAGLPPDAQGLRAHGYPEIVRYLTGAPGAAKSRAELSAQITLVVRKYSKRQRTWFRAVAGAKWIEIEGMPTEAMVDEVAREWRWPEPSGMGATQ